MADDMIKSEDQCVFENEQFISSQKEDLEELHQNKEQHQRLLARNEKTERHIMQWQAQLPGVQKRISLAKASIESVDEEIAICEQAIKDAEAAQAAEAAQHADHDDSDTGAAPDSASTRPRPISRVPPLPGGR